MAEQSTYWSCSPCPGGTYGTCASAQKHAGACLFAITFGRAWKAAIVGGLLKRKMQPSRKKKASVSSWVAAAHAMASNATAGRVASW